MTSSASSPKTNVSSDEFAADELVADEFASDELASNNPSSSELFSNETHGVKPRSIFITGGSRGIGRAIAQRFIADGHRVATADRSGSGPDGALALKCDITDSEQVNAAIEVAEAAHGPIEILVANSGITKDTLMLRMSEADWDTVMDVNLKGAFRVTQRCVKSMLRAKWGRIIFIGSLVGLYGGPGQCNYAASKAALVGFARSLTREVGSRGITANVVAPGFIETDMTAVLPEETVAGYRKMIPAGRMGQVEDVAAAVAYLASDAAGFVSGAVLPVDGGMGMGH